MPRSRTLANVAKAAPKMISLADAAKLIPCSRWMAAVYADRGLFETVEIAGRRLAVRRDVERFAARRRAARVARAQRSRKAPGSEPDAAA